MLYRDMTTLLSVDALTDSELLAQVMTLAQRERHVTADLIATLAELDVRRLYLAAGDIPRCFRIARTRRHRGLCTLAPRHVEVRWAYG
jgi:hypothetical protein